MSMIQIEPGAAKVIGRLRAAGFTAFAVGGCVRDALLGDVPSDWDITTSARPEQTIAVFGEETCIPTGVKHGTITVRMDGGLYEVTTFRTESGYSDGRHPDAVAFMTDVRDDLARRDFTINAMAYSEEEGLIDPFGGLEDLFVRRVVRAVGEAMVRFEEDALRILRLMRFAARFSFEMEGKTLRAAVRLAGNIRRVSAERIREEIVKLLLAPAPAAYMPREIMNEAVLALGALSAEDWERTLRAVDRVPAEPALRMAALLQALGGDGARSAMKMLKCSNEQIDGIGALVDGLSMAIEPEPVARRMQAKRLLGGHGLAYIEKLALLRAAVGAEQGEDMTVLLSLAREIESQGLCCRMSQLAVTGNELMAALGMKPGREVGALLAWLFDEVLAERTENSKTALLAAAKGHAQAGKNVL